MNFWTSNCMDDNVNCEVGPGRPTLYPQPERAQPSAAVPTLGDCQSRNQPGKNGDFLCYTPGCVGALNRMVLLTAAEELDKDCVWIAVHMWTRHAVHASGPGVHLRGGTICAPDGRAGHMVEV